MDLISVIVPVYKVEEYLDRCVESIAHQTYRNLEIILVDDGSPDNCGAMCDAWAAKDGRIRVVHKENGGLSDARNAGMAVVSGDYICFVDSDDQIHSEYVSWLLRACREHGADIAACDLLCVHSTAIPDAYCEYRSQAYMPSQAMETLIHGHGFRAIACNKLFRRDLLDGERFPVGRYHEDEFFTYRILAKAKALAYVDVPLYYYLQREGSIMQTASSRHLDALDAYLERLEFLKNRYSRLYQADKATFCSTCVNFYLCSGQIGLQERKIYQSRIKAYRNSVAFSLKELKQYSPSQLAYILGSKWNIDLFCKLLSAKRKS